MELGRAKSKLSQNLQLKIVSRSVKEQISSCVFIVIALERHELSAAFLDRFPWRK